MSSIPAATARPAPLDVTSIRRDFPILQQQVYGKPLVYLDSASTTQKPQAVIDRLTRFYVEENANVHRGVHRLSEQATDAYEAARAGVASFLNAAEPREIVFVRGTTEAINLVAQSYGRSKVGQGDAIVISAMEHHSNIVPWQLLCEERDAELRVIPTSDAGELDLDRYETLLDGRTRLVSVVHVSNALGHAARSHGCTAPPIGRRRLAESSSRDAGVPTNGARHERRPALCHDLLQRHGRGVVRSAAARGARARVTISR